jgi:hypothetical protein
MDNKNSIPAFTEETTKKKKSEPVVLPKSSKDTPATNLEASPSSPKPAKGAKNTKRKSKESPNTGLRPLATFIVKKYILSDQINWPRDLIIAYKLLKKYPDENFWRGLPVLRQVQSMALLYGPKAKQRLQYAYADYEKQKTLTAQIKIEKPEVIILEENKVGEDREFKPKKKSILDFCK